MGKSKATSPYAWRGGPKYVGHFGEPDDGDGDSQPGVVGRREQHYYDRACELVRAPIAKTRVDDWKQIAKLVVDDWDEKFWPDGKAKSKKDIKGEVIDDFLELQSPSTREALGGAKWLTEEEQQEQRAQIERDHLEMDDEDDKRDKLPPGTQLVGGLARPTRR